MEVAKVQTWYSKLWDVIKELWDSVKSFFSGHKREEYADLGVFDAYEKMSIEEIGNRLYGLLMGGKRLPEFDNNAINNYAVQYATSGDFDVDGSVRPEVLTDIRKEREEIKEKAKANGTFMKAPNGEPTKLNEDQWVTVRTNRFKKWFGDWELVNIYKMLGKGGVNDVFLQVIDNYINRIYNDLRRRNKSLVLERFSHEEQQEWAKGGEIYAGASIISGREDSSNRAIKETQDERNERQESDVEAYAKAKGVWVENTDEALREKYGDPIGKGQESKVYDNGKTVVKSKNTLQYYDLQSTLDSIALHNMLFPESALTVTGFGKDSEGGFVIIMEQPFIKGTPLTQKEVDEYAANLGFEKENSGLKGHYKNSQTLLHDLHTENALRGEDGTIFVLDDIIRFNTPDENAGGERIVPAISSSQVVDENGEPLVVYNNSGNKDDGFTVFERQNNRRGLFDENSVDSAFNAFFFTKDKNVADTYSSTIKDGTKIKVNKMV